MKPLQLGATGLIAGALLTAGCADLYSSPAATRAMGPPFGGADDVAYAHDLWNAMQRRHLVGPGAIMSAPYTGTHPHGAILDTVDARVQVRSDEGPVIIKRNYRGKDVSKSNVANNPGKYLKAVTVMFKRPGYDPEDRDWFWVKYAPDGSILKNPKGMTLAGRVAKGKPMGCIACHKGAPGGDMVFNHDRYR